MEVIMVGNRKGMFVLVLALLVSPLLSCGEAPEEEPVTESQPAAEAPASEEPAATAEEPAAEPVANEAEEAPEQVEAELPESRVLVIGADGHHRGEVVSVLADVAKKMRPGDFTKLSVGGKTTVSWVQSGRRFVVVDFPNLEALQEGIKEGPWSGVVFVSDPAQSTGNRDAFLEEARGAGITKIVLFQVVSDLLTDMEVYDLEAQVWPDELSGKGFSGDGMPTLQADVAKAAAGSSSERKPFEDLVKSIETHLR